MPLTLSEVEKETTKDRELSKLLKMLRENKTIPHAVRFGIDISEFSIQNNCLFRGIRMVVPQTLRKRVLLDLHSAHFGVTRMLSLARGFCWWPGLDKDIKTLISNCPNCMERKNNPPEIYHHWSYRLSLCRFRGSFSGHLPAYPDRCILKMA